MYKKLKYNSFNSLLPLIKLRKVSCISGADCVGGSRFQALPEIILWGLTPPQIFVIYHIKMFIHMYMQMHIHYI